MSQPVLGATDTETGGLNVAVNPLLSCSLIIADDNFAELTNLTLKLSPPVGTLMEIPIPEHQNPQIKAKTIAYYAEVFTGQRVERADAAGAKYIITAVAAEINGYIPTTPEGRWVLEFPPEWHRHALGYDVADAQFCHLLDAAFTQPCVIAAHNAPFDKKFIEAYLPKYAAKIGTWVDTCAMLKAWRGKTKVAGRNTLDELCVLAQYDIAKDRAVHDALCDARGCLRGLQWLSRT